MSTLALRTAGELFIRNGKCCSELTSKYTLRSFMSNQTVFDFFLNYERGFGHKTLPLFIATLSALPFFGENSSTYTSSPHRYNPHQLFTMFLGSSGASKSKYIRTIYEEAREAEKLLFERRPENEKEELLNFFSIKHQSSNQQQQSTLSNAVNDISFIEQILSHSQLLNSIAMNNIMICSPESDGIMTAMNFYKPSLNNEETTSTIISLYDGDKITRHNMNKREAIEDRSLSMLVASTGSKMQEILIKYNDYPIVTGFHQRFLYWYLPEGTTGDGHYDDLQLNGIPSLQHVFLVRGLLGRRIYKFTPAALNFLSPILDALRRGTDSESLATRASSSSLHELATQRRGCEQIIRLASNLQVLVDCLQICHQVKNFNFNIINSDFISAANEIIHSNF
ncbi:unnamed protein product, partial [Didymodactylos carnosus]